MLAIRPLLLVSLMKQGKPVDNARYRAAFGLQCSLISVRYTGLGGLPGDLNHLGPRRTYSMTSSTMMRLFKISTQPHTALWGNNKGAYCIIIDSKRDHADTKCRCIIRSGGYQAYHPDLPDSSSAGVPRSHHPSLPSPHPIPILRGSLVRAQKTKLRARESHCYEAPMSLGG